MRIPYRRRPSPVPNATNGRKEKSIACSECHNCQKRGGQCKKRSPGCRREQENHSQKVCNTAPNLLNTSRKSRCRQNPLNATPKKLLGAPGIFAACYGSGGKPCVLRIDFLWSKKKVFQGQGENPVCRITEKVCTFG